MFISQNLLFFAQMWTHIAEENFDSFERKLRVLDPEKIDDIEVMEWEEYEKNRLADLVQTMDENIAAIRLPEPDLDAIESVFEEERKLTLPDLAYNGGYWWNFKQLSLAHSAMVLKAARDANKSVVGTIVVNRSTMLRQEDGPPQSALNGHHGIASTWLHNYVCHYLWNKPSCVCCSK